jgi:hypothetical protein
MNYINTDQILATNNPISGLTSKNISHVRNVIFDTVDDISILMNVFTLRGDFLHQIDNIGYKITPGPVLVDMKSAFEQVSITNGSYRVGVSIVKPISKTNIIEVSPDLTEVKLPLISITDSELSLRKNGSTFKVIAHWSDESYTYLKLMSEYDLTDLLGVYIVSDLTDEIFDTVNIFRPLQFKSGNKLKGPRFDIDADSVNSELSVLKSWDDLLSTDTKTAQEIIDSIFQVDNSVTLNVDWTYFNNYIFYSKALERFENFYNKVLIIEEYNAKIVDLDLISGSESTELSYSNNIDRIVRSFDSFERYLYYIVDPKIFTHETIGPVLPWPKFTDVEGEIKLLPSNNQTVITWYNNLKKLAINYDLQNLNSLQYSIPEHLLMNDSNSEYILFVDMIAQHFDNIWLYVNALTEIHNKDEHSERGPARELLNTIANSFGWKLENTRNLSDLWLYKLGKDSNGSDIEVGNMLSHEKQSEQVWRRIVNNLPLLLKSKGTSRSIKSLMSIYGIPSTLISIKEYGGSSLNDEPMYIEDRYHYKLKLSNQNRKLIFNLNVGEELINPDCELTIFNGDFSKGLLDWGIQVVDGGEYPEIDENLGSIDNANAIFCVSAETRLIKNLNLEKNKRYQLQFRSWRPSTPAPNEDGRFQLKFNNAPVLLYAGEDSYVEGNASDNDVVWSSLVIGSEENLLEIYTIDDNISFWEFKILEVAFPERYPDTYEFRFQYNEDMGEDGDLMIFNLSDGRKTSFRLITVNDNLHVRQLEIYEDGEGSSNLIHLSDPINFEFLEFYTFRLYRDNYNEGTFYYDIANSADSLLGELNNHISGSFILNELLNSAIGHQLEISFTGYIQGYKEYFGIYSPETFKSHVLNPGSYSTDEFNGAYNYLFTYYPFGLDLQKFDHSSGVHPSSQPNINFISSELIMTGFSSDQSLNYHNDSETYYIDSPSLGGRNIYSKKIRIDDDIIENAILNTENKVARKFNYYNADSNRLAIVFSLADQINRDVFNHINGDDLNNSIGSPADEFNYAYGTLEELRRNYFKKYQSRNDINTFIRLLSAYDYSFFEQIKQLTPGSANLIAGILIEPHILEKNKQIIMKPINISNEFIEMVYDLKINKEFGDVEQLESLMNVEYPVVSNSDVLKTIIENGLFLKSKYDKLSSCLVITNELRVIYANSISGPGVQVKVSGSGNHEPIIDDSRINCKYLKRNYICTSETRPEYSVYRYLDVEIPPEYSNYSFTYEITDTSTILNLDKRPFARHISFRDVNMDFGTTATCDITFPDIYLDAGNYIARFYVEWMDGIYEPDNSRLNIVLSGSESLSSTSIGLNHSMSTSTRIVHPYIIEINSNVSDMFALALIFELMDGIPTDSTFRLYGFDIFKNTSDYEKQIITLDNCLNGTYQFQTNRPWSYQNNEESISNNSRFTGSKITSPGWNLPSNDLYDPSPVVSFNIVDPNVLSVHPLKDSNLKVN